jgi:uncharacterized radical SAM superfamily Fe-S cluster-containing enzyme
MNRAYCNSCNELVPGTPTERDGKVYLVKECPDCGQTETLISADAQRYWKKRSLDSDFEYQSCRLNCLGCKHPKQPNIVFVDVTNRCNLNCPVCINNTPSMGFLFEPPFDYFDRIFKHLATLRPKPSIQLFGGEPTVRDDIFEIVRCARSYGLSARLVTNGIKLANKEYCQRVIDSKATILLAYDGNNPETYRVLRGSDKMLPKKLQALDNIHEIGSAKVTLMTLLARDFNDHEIPEMFAFAHERKDCVRAIYFMPLAHTWDDEDFDLQPERTTTEDIEQMVAEVFGDETIDFMPAGLIGTFESLLACLSTKTVPFMGAHPNCESVYFLVSDGEKFLPLSRYLKTSIMDLGRALGEVDKKLAKHVKKYPNPTRFQQRKLLLRAILALLAVFRRHARLGQVFKGRGIAKLYHALATLGGFVVGKKSRPILRAHTNVQGVLQLIILPFEDRSNLETDRLERCPAAFAFYEPDKDKVSYVPTCAWGLHKKEMMRHIAEFYGTAKPVAEAVK